MTISYAIVGMPLTADPWILLYMYSFSMCLGYGHIAPKTAVGKIVTIFYAIVGMPLTVLCCSGYGHIAPKTAVGKIVTIFYAIVGMPLTVLCWSNIGAAMANAFR